MSFNKGIQVDPNRVSTRSTGGGGRGVAIGGGSVFTVIALVILSQLTGVDLTGMLAGDGSSSQAGSSSTSSTIDMSVCGTGSDANGDAANTYTQCRMAATAESLDAVWGEQLPAQAKVDYVKPEFLLWDGSSVSTACGSATSSVGPFYCPGDSTVYLDMSFFQEMEGGVIGAADTPLAEEYIVAHEFGHHIQNELGLMNSTDRSGTGATSDSVRTELQADCYAGVWVHYASTTKDPETGQTFLTEPTQDEIQSALDAAAAVGDDHIQQRSSGTVDADSWTHGSSAQRQKWFTTGLKGGQIGQCDTFSVSGSQL